MNGYREILAEKIKYLPDDKVGELIHLIDFFVKETDTEKKGILLSLSGSLSGSPVSSEDMDRQLYGDMKIS